MILSSSVDHAMTSIQDNEKISFGVEFLEKVTGLARELDLRSRRRNEPNFRVEAVQFIEHIMEMVNFVFNLEFVFTPSDQADVYGVISGASLIRKGLVGCL